MHDTAVLVNEFGEVGLDHHLIQRLDEQTILLGNGCVCCTVRRDLVQALTTLLDRDQRGIIAPLRRVVIETTGLADPAPLVFTVVTDPMLQHHFRIDSVVTTVDAVNGSSHLDRHPVSRKQVALADEIIITKTDLALPDTVAVLRERLRRDNPAARMTTAILGDLDPQWLLGPQASHPTVAHTTVTVSPELLQRTPYPSGASHPHGTEIRSLALTFTQPLDWIAFSVWLSMLLHAHGEAVLRVKGLLNVGATGPVVLNGVQHILHPPEHLATWPGEDRRSHLVLILHALEPEAIRTSLQAFQHPLGAYPTVDSDDHVP
jgi:G3E family GTPase